MKVDFNPNRQPNEIKQNARFNGPVVLNALARSDRKSDGRIFKNRKMFAEGSKSAKQKNCERSNILCAVLHEF